MSQNESKSKGNNLLMPLAIGGGLLLLFMGMKKAKAQGEGSLPVLPEIDAKQAAQQIVPDAAPKYTDVVENDDNDDDSNTTNHRPASSSNSSPNYKTLPSNSYEEDDEESTNSSGYQFNNSVPKSNSATKLNQRQENIVGNGKPKLGIRAHSDQNRKFAERGGIVNAKVAQTNSLRSQSDQARLAQQKVRNNSSVKSPIPFITQAQKAIAQSKSEPKIFPLKQGQSNNYIKEVQRKMGVSPTGFFGTQTRAALLKKYKVTEVSEALYKQIVSGKALIAKPIIPLKSKIPLIKRPIKILRKK